MAFEEHIVNARRNRGLEVPPEWYEIPVFYFTNPGAVYRDGDEIPKPPDTAAARLRARAGVRDRR